MVDKAAGVEASAISLLTRAVELDTKQMFTEALVCYQEGIQLLMVVLKGNVKCTSLHIVMYNSGSLSNKNLKAVMACVELRSIYTFYVCIINLSVIHCQNTLLLSLNKNNFKTL